MKLSVEISVQIENGELTLRNPQGKEITFSQEQEVQKKASMVVLGEMSNLPKSQIAEAFGFANRKSYYNIRQQLLHGKLEDLQRKKTGPKERHKRTQELEKVVIQMRFESGDDMYEITRKLKEKGINISSRLIGQILTDYGISKKKQNT